jgi:hypothetical protein
MAGTVVINIHVSRPSLSTRNVPDEYALVVAEDLQNMITQLTVTEKNHDLIVS